MDPDAELVSGEGARGNLEFLNYWWNDKKLYVTSHVLDELDEFDKTIDFVCEVLDNGEHKLESERAKDDCKAEDW